MKRLKKPPPLDDDTVWKPLEEPDDGGVRGASEEIDAYVYGERSGPVR